MVVETPKILTETVMVLTQIITAKNKEKRLSFLLIKANWTAFFIQINQCIQVLSKIPFLPLYYINAFCSKWFRSFHKLVYYLKIELH
ncbi:hypothetical protein B1NLA3E_00820 [Bacillus sp. 1NLA3E]|nr:hypothetical protein B1NLA3E_00820 [Bacillus sp. 1NLA3E]